MNDINDIKLIIIIGSVLLIIIAAFIVVFFLIYRTRQHRHVKEKELLYSHYQQELLRTQLEIQEQTLKNISQEIHDNIGQTLSLAKLNLNTIDLGKDSAFSKVTSSKELVSKAIHDLRNLSRSLNTDSILSAGLIKAIETELSIIENAGAFTTTFHKTGGTIPIDNKKELILFRIVQEALNNIIKHSGASSITVNTMFNTTTLKIEIDDNGKGFPMHARNEGSGLRNMKSRAQLIGGNLDVQSGFSGTIVTIILPITEI